MKFIKYIINVYFSKHAPQEIRADSFTREIYCAGIYNKTPIFQWYTPSDKSKKYYSDNKIKLYTRVFNFMRKDIGLLGDMAIVRASKNQSNTVIKEKTLSREGIKEAIKSLPIAYVITPFKLVRVLSKYQKKSIFFYLLSPIRLLSTILTSLVTKFTIK